MQTIEVRAPGKSGPVSKTGPKKLEDLEAEGKLAMDRLEDIANYMGDYGDIVDEYAVSYSSQEYLFIPFAFSVDLHVLQILYLLQPQSHGRQGSGLNELSFCGTKTRPCQSLFFFLLVHTTTISMKNIHVLQKHIMQLTNFLCEGGRRTDLFWVDLEMAVGHPSPATA